MNKSRLCFKRAFMEKAWRGKGERREGETERDRERGEIERDRGRQREGEIEREMERERDGKRREGYKSLSCTYTLLYKKSMHITLEC